MIQLLTMTGARPHAFKLCQRWMCFQRTWSIDVRWVIVDDGPEPSEFNHNVFKNKGWKIEIVRPEPFWQPGQNTQGRNILVGLEHIDPKIPLAIIEDDDWYHPDWLRNCKRLMETRDLGGEGNNRYYNVPERRWRQFTNAPHKASLCATVMKGEPIDILKQVVYERLRGDRGTLSSDLFDIALWKRAGDMTINRAELTNMVVGIKGLPGRPGIGIGHKGARLPNHDPNGAVLQEWVGIHDALDIEAVARG